MNICLNGWYFMEYGSGWVIAISGLRIRIRAATPYKGICEVQKIIESKYPGLKCTVKVHDGGLLCVYTETENKK